MPVSLKQAPLESTLEAVETAILSTVAYADVFDYPLTLDQIHRYLVSVRASRSAVHNALHSERLVPRRLTRTDGYYSLAGREGIVQTRLRRAEVAARLWPTARRYGRLIALLPFVRMVAITGTLAVSNGDDDADIDYLIVTTPHRVWLARSLVIVLVHRGRLEHVEICPNYVISTDALNQFDRTFFSAHELAQMVPLYDDANVYGRLLESNRWARAYLPNAFEPGSSCPDAFGLGGKTLKSPISRTRQRLKQGAERILQSRLGDYWERRESNFKIRQLNAEAAYLETNAAHFSPQRCKGHMDDHGNHIQAAYAERLERLGIDLQDVWPQSSAKAAGQQSNDEEFI